MCMLWHFYFFSDSGITECPSVRLISPERLSFGINPAVSTVTTVAEIREQYNEVDSRLIAKEVPQFDQFWIICCALTYCLPACNGEV